MGKGKQGKQIMLFAVLLGGLIIAVIVQFSGAKKGGATTAAPQAAATEASADPATENAEEETADLSWVDVKFMPVVIDIVTRGRDPFRDNLEPRIAEGEQKPAPASTLVIDLPKVNTTLPPFDKLPDPPPADVKPEIPPIPPFVLCGVISTPIERMASIRINDRYYTLLEGEAIPGLGWRVTTIQTDAVMLSKNKDTVLIRMSGGDQK